MRFSWVIMTQFMLASCLPAVLAAAASKEVANSNTNYAKKDTLVYTKIQIQTYEMFQVQVQPYGGVLEGGVSYSPLPPSPQYTR